MKLLYKCYEEIKINDDNDNAIYNTGLVEEGIEWWKGYANKNARGMQKKRFKSRGREDWEIWWHFILSDLTSTYAFALPHTVT